MTLVPPLKTPKRRTDWNGLFIVAISHSHHIFLYYICFCVKEESTLNNFLLFLFSISEKMPKNQNFVWQEAHGSSCGFKITSDPIKVCGRMAQSPILGCSEYMFWSVLSILVILFSNSICDMKPPAYCKAGFPTITFSDANPGMLMWTISPGIRYTVCQTQLCGAAAAHLL